MNYEKLTKIRELYQKARGISSMSGKFMKPWEYDFALSIIQECTNIVDAFGIDVEHGNIFNNKEFKQLEEDIKANHLGPVLWCAADQIKELFNVDQS